MDSAWRDARVLVTGAGGFVGSHLVEELVRSGAQVRALVRYVSRGDAGWLDSCPCRDDVEVIAGDVRDPQSVDAALTGVEAVFHLAALIGIPYSYVNPLGYVRTNVEGTLNLLEAARRAGVRVFVHTSTSEVYGTARDPLIDEQHPLSAQSPYAASKIGADQLVFSYWRSYGVPVVVVRPFNVYGPRQSARAVIPSVITQALTGGPVRLGALTPRRDLTYVTDTARGFVAAAASGDAVGQVLNLGTGKDVSVEEIVTTVGDLLGVQLRVEHDPARDRPSASEVERLCADTRRVRDTTGWASEVTLEEGLARTIEFLRVNLDHYRPEQYRV